ncbi:hypothetical protein BDQ12DRAFT_612637 [Crucibulum laeve]|uniref:Prolyl 4-hydroxylase alpha subunit Fe(2+) 2OG dioxygenase domain-containing protein n=1 Tax=Crucibulum laeve TaxID=68775 RepID=A0A5C3LPU1_9AGAR|nr:hypothetical protein BDQ12DRAFT_612637 [Crucibulum laeve]
MYVDATERIAPTSLATTERILPANHPPIVYSPANAHQSLAATENGSMMKVDPPEHNASKDMEDVDGGGDEDEDESIVSDGDDLIDDLEAALNGDFDFKGDYYYASILSQAPNPCLFISGLGLVGLPLSERDAKLIIGCSVQAPYGQGHRTLVNTDVRDTWEIEPANIRFANPEWEPYVQQLAVKSVCQALGVAPSRVAPRCELYKLLLYQSGSQCRMCSFLPHQDTQKADGMFATVIILLPSAYTGGEVYVSHASTNKVLDFASTSLTSSAILAWYTDVMHEVKPVTSGYRLALSYNLIHTSPSMPRPVLPDMNYAVTCLHNVLRKWFKDAYAETPESNNLVAYLLKHQYNAANLNAGSRALKGEDAHKIAYLRHVAAELGYTVCLGNLVCNVSGCPDDDGCHYGGWERHGYYDSPSEDPSMGEVIDTVITVTNVVDLDGNSMLGNKSLTLDETCLIPKDPFADLEPDDREYEGYVGNGAGQLDYFYRRTVLILIREDDAPNVLFSAGGVHYALQRLAKSNSLLPSPEDRKMASLILANLSSGDTTTPKVMVEYTLKWNDVEMWKTLTKASGCVVSTFKAEQFIQAWKQFSFESVQASFAEILSRSPRMKDRLDFIHALLTHASPEDQEAVKEWSEKQTFLALTSYESPVIEDIPTLISNAHGKGIATIDKLILSRLLKKPSLYTFWIAFVKALHLNKKELLAYQPTTLDEEPPTSDTIDAIIERCLDAAVLQWNTVVSQPAYSGTTHSYYGANTFNQPQQAKINRVIELVEMYILTGHIQPCKKLFVLLFKVEGNVATKFQTLYTPLIPRLRDVLNKNGIDICSTPFIDLMQLFIGSYLRDMLGSKDHNPRPNIRKVGCGCGDCNQIDAFMGMNSVAQQTFRMAQTRRLHVERQLAMAPDLVTFVTIRSGSPHGISVTKRADVLAATRWDSRKAEAKKFLSSIGNEAILSKLMGHRYDDVLNAVKGTRPFVWTVSDAGAQGQMQQASTSFAPYSRTTSVTGSVASNPSASSSSNTQVSANANTLAGKKRKPVVQLGPVIDLTGDDSS